MDEIHLITQISKESAKSRKLAGTGLGTIFIGARIIQIVQAVDVYKRQGRRRCSAAQWRWGMRRFCWQSGWRLEV